MSTNPSVKSLRDLQKLKVEPVVQTQRAGGFFKARYAGTANCVFGASPAEARERLLNTPSKLVHNNKRNGLVREHNGVNGFRLGKA